MRVAFAGSPAAAVPPLRDLAGSRHEVSVVVTQPDRARGRSRTPAPTPVALAAQELGIPVLRPATINAPEVVEEIAATGAQALVVVAFGQILRDAVLDRWPCVNVHFSLLPAYRGAAPVERAIMDGVSRTGVTIMRMDAGLDTGPMLASRAVEVGEDEDAGALTARLSALGGPLLVEVLDELEAGRLEAVPQPQEGVSHAPKIGPEDRALDFSRPAEELARRVRALSPHVGATCAIGGREVKVWAARALADDAPAPLSADGGRLVAACGRGSLELLEVQPQGKARMDAAAFLRGWRGPLELGAAGG
jgi:methionyl-tRNA formyltransferase